MRESREVSVNKLYCWVSSSSMKCQNNVSKQTDRASLSIYLTMKLHCSGSQTFRASESPSNTLLIQESLILPHTIYLHMNLKHFQNII
jgi:hypothetical protein